jgi:hypothetical protein
VYVYIYVYIEEDEEEEGDEHTSGDSMGPRSAAKKSTPPSPLARAPSVPIMGAKVDKKN